MAEKVIIFGKSGWPYTDKARSAYGKNAEYVDVKAESDKLEEMLEYSGGVRKVPVIVQGEKVTVGYGGTWGVWWLTVGDCPSFFRALEISPLGRPSIMGLGGIITMDDFQFGLNELFVGKI
jgi:glutaredoxin 3